MESIGLPPKRLLYIKYKILNKSDSRNSSKFRLIEANLPQCQDRRGGRSEYRELRGSHSPSRPGVFLSLVPRPVET